MGARDGSVQVIDPSIGMYMSFDGSSMVIDMESGKFIVYDGRGMSIDPTTGRYIGYDGRDLGTNKTNVYGNELFVSKRVKKKKLKPKMWGPGAPVIRIVEPCFDAKGWEKCVDCKYNDFCDKPRHKDEYIHLRWEDEKKSDEELMEEAQEECTCTVCSG